jgi:hypothetical protein
MRHASIQTTYGLHGKLMPGSEAQAAALVDAYLTRSDTASRIVQISRNEVDLFDFRGLLVGRVQLRWYRRCLYSSTHCLLEYH